MKEYETLRNEVVQRINARQQVAGYGAVIVAIAATLGGDMGWWRYLVAALLILLAVGYLRDSNKGIQRIGLHLQELERGVNSLAEELYGEPVLYWETRRQGQREKWIWRGTGIFGGWHLRKPSKELPSPRTSPDESESRTSRQ